MAYVDRPNDYLGERTLPMVAASDRDRVHWGPIIAGLVVALSTQLVLSALGVAVGASSIGDSGAPRTDAGGVGVGIGIWSIISLLISLFAGGWTAARTAGRMSRNTALLNGTILWASMLALSAWLLSSGVSGAFGVAASNAGSVINQVRQVNPTVVPTTPGQVAAKTPNITAQQTRDLAGNTAKVSWSFVFGSLLGLVASLLGSAVGHRNTRLNALPDRE
jgi:hypothetical protein